MIFCDGKRSERRSRQSVCPEVRTHVSNSGKHPPLARPVHGCIDRIAFSEFIACCRTHSTFPACGNRSACANVGTGVCAGAWVRLPEATTAAKAAVHMHRNGCSLRVPINAPRAPASPLCVIIQSESYTVLLTLPRRWQYRARESGQARAAVLPPAGAARRCGPPPADSRST
jgi:hypothetical protein